MCHVARGGRDGKEGGGGGGGGRGQIDGDDHPLAPSAATGQSNHRQLCPYLQRRPLVVTGAFLNVDAGFSGCVLWMQKRHPCIYST